MNYQVGQVLYTCNEKSLKIIPLQIVEIVVRTTINGEKKEYIVQLPDKENTTTSLESIGGNIFSDIDTIRTHLIDNATSAIDKMINLANSIVTERFINVNNVVQNNTSMQVDTNNDIIMVDLGNGVKAKMNTKNLNQAIDK